MAHIHCMHVTLMNQHNCSNYIQCMMYGVSLYTWENVHDVMYIMIEHAKAVKGRVDGVGAKVGATISSEGSLPSTIREI